MGRATAAVVAMAAPPHNPNVTGSRIIRTVPRSRMVALSASYSSRVFDMDDEIVIDRRYCIRAGMLGAPLPVHLDWYAPCRGVLQGYEEIPHAVEFVKWLRD